MKKLFVLIFILCITYDLSSQAPCGLSTLSTCSTSPQFSIGTETNVNMYSNYPSIYGNWYRNARHQLLYTATELTTAGVMPGDISSVSFFINSFHTGYIGTLPGLKISLKCVSQTSLAPIFDTVGLTQVFYSAGYSPVVGINTHNFTSAYQWNGVSDLLVDICYDYISTSLYTNNPIMPTTTTSQYRCVYGMSDITALCGADTSSVLSLTFQRANIVFGNCTSVTSLDSKVQLSNGVDIFPNPSTGIFTIKNSTEKCEISIINAIGQVVKSLEMKNATQTTLDMSSMSKGIYYVKVSSAEGTKLFKLILE